MDHSNHFDEARLLEEACEAAALTDFGNDDFRGPLSALLAALGGEAPLNEAGAAIMRGRILESLVSRLRAEDWFRRYPEILEEHYGYSGALQWSRGTLSNGGENLQLLDRRGNRVDEVRYFEGGFGVQFLLPLSPDRFHAGMTL